MTGRSSGRKSLGVRFGRYTFRYRQSSVVLATPKGDGGCGQWLANCCALRMPFQGVTGSGGRKRRSPTGGAA
jgi:hypothetical protein